MTRFHILSALAPGPGYPYQIARDVLAATGGQVALEAGNLHRRLQQLVTDGLVTEAETPPESTDRRRRYYALTRSGRAALRTEASALERAARSARAALASGSRR